MDPPSDYRDPSAPSNYREPDLQAQCESLEHEIAALDGQIVPLREDVTALRARLPRKGFHWLRFVVGMVVGFIGLGILVFIALLTLT